MFGGRDSRFSPYGSSTGPHSHSHIRRPMTSLPLPHFQSPADPPPPSIPQSHVRSGIEGEAAYFESGARSEASTSRGFKGQATSAAPGDERGQDESERSVQEGVTGLGEYVEEVVSESPARSNDVYSDFQPPTTPPPAPRRRRSMAMTRYDNTGELDTPRVMHTCEECYKAFSRRDNLMSHFKSHMSPTSRSIIKITVAESLRYLDSNGKVRIPLKSNHRAQQHQPWTTRSAHPIPPHPARLPSLAKPSITRHHSTPTLSTHSGSRHHPVVTTESFLPSTSQSPYQYRRIKDEPADDNDDDVPLRLAPPAVLFGEGELKHLFPPTHERTFPTHESFLEAGGGEGGEEDGVRRLPPAAQSSIANGPPVADVRPAFYGQPELHVGRWSFGSQDSSDPMYSPPAGDSPWSPPPFRGRSDSAGSGSGSSPRRHYVPTFYESPSPTTGRVRSGSGSSFESLVDKYREVKVDDDASRPTSRDSSQVVPQQQHPHQLYLPSSASFTSPRLPPPFLDSAPASPASSSASPPTPQSPQSPITAYPSPPSPSIPSLSSLHLTSPAYYGDDSTLAPFLAPSPLSSPSSPKSSLADAFSPQATWVPSPPMPLFDSLPFCPVSRAYEPPLEPYESDGGFRPGWDHFP
ncbi:hypothetical protein RQP46_007752 [Phenoliferia psychrophenolica]